MVVRLATARLDLPRLNEAVSPASPMKMIECRMRPAAAWCGPTRPAFIGFRNREAPFFDYVVAVARLTVWI